LSILKKISHLTPPLSRNTPSIKNSRENVKPNSHDVLIKRSYYQYSKRNDAPGKTRLAKRWFAFDAPMVFESLNSRILNARAERRCKRHCCLRTLHLKGLREITVIAGWAAVCGFTLFSREQQLLSRRAIHHAKKRN